MSTLRIQIATDNSLTERSARISLKTWQAIKAKKNNAFFPEGNQIVIGENPFDPMYIIFVVDEGLPDDLFFVSEDVKSKVYPSIGFLEV